MLDNFSFVVQRAILLAETYAKEFSHLVVGSEHLLLGLLKNEDLLISKELEKQGIKHKAFFDKIRTLYPKEKKIKDVKYSLELKDVLQESIKLGHKNKEPLISVDTLSFVLLTLNNTALELLENNGVKVELIVKKIAANHKKKSELLSVTDLHLLGVNNKDPLIGRDNEIVQLVYSLSRRNKPNAILIGEPGVGKTAIVEELAKRLINNQIPLLKDKVIYELDLASTVSGTKYRGEFEEKLKKIIKKVKEDGNAILFIDEIHNVIKAGGAEGAIDASNILKPYLARGDIQVIGATTLEEFNDSFDKDKALKRRFQIINVNEPSPLETLNILSKIKPIYEDYYNIQIPSELLNVIIEYADNFIINQRFPDKAIELLDNSCVIAYKTLSKSNILETMNKLYNVNISNKEKILKLKEEIEENIVDQTKIKEQILNIFTKGKVNTLLLYGQNGVGKNTISQMIGKTIYDNNFINLKIDNYLDIYGVNRLVSNGISYVGEQVSLLVKTLKEKPNSVIIFEGIEKANSELLSFFQTMLEKGFFLDSKGLKLSIRNALFIFTMNQIEDNEFRFNFTPKYTSSLNVEKIEKKLGYKFVSLIDEILCFDNIDQNMFKKIVSKELSKYNYLYELSEIPEIEDNILLYNGGDAAVKRAKELIKEEKNKKIINLK